MHRLEDAPFRPYGVVRVWKGFEPHLALEEGKGAGRVGVQAGAAGAKAI
jgi:hypothetical protein